MHILIAPNAFKNSATAAVAAEAIREGLTQSKLTATYTCFPVADGGDGTASLLIKNLGAIIIPSKVHDPLGRMIDASFGWIEKIKTAIIEMADASGLKLIRPEEIDVMHASSFGTGELIKQAMDKGASHLLICIGGSATVDGGSGILEALGIRFLDTNGVQLNGSPDSMMQLASIDISGIDNRINRVCITVLCDVDTLLLGELGAAAVFGPQKGAGPDHIIQLEKMLSLFNSISFKTMGKDLSIIRHGGAAGGVAAGLYGFLNAQLVNGADYFLDITGFEKELEKADLLITGEGSIDEQTLQGKAPFAVARRAKEKGIRVIGLAGKIPSQKSEELQKYFDLLLSINKEETELAVALKNTEANLKNAASELGALISLG